MFVAFEPLPVHRQEHVYHEEESLRGRRLPPELPHDEGRERQVLVSEEGCPGAPPLEEGQCELEDVDVHDRGQLLRGEHPEHTPVQEGAEPKVLPLEPPFQPESADPEDRLEEGRVEPHLQGLAGEEEHLDQEERLLPAEVGALEDRGDPAEDSEREAEDRLVEAEEDVDVTDDDEDGEVSGVEDDVGGCEDQPDQGPGDVEPEEGPGPRGVAEPGQLREGVRGTEEEGPDGPAREGQLVEGVRPGE